MLNLSENKIDSTLLNVRIGVFFDGTGLNANNMVCKEADDEYLYSNIYRLYKYYGNNSDTNDKSVYLKAYIEGVGTKNNEKNNIVVEATGIDNLLTKGLGVFSKYNNGVSSVSKQISDYLKNKSIKDYHLGITFDVFGFSRGAAVARHFTNKIAKQDKDFMEQIRLAVEPYSCSLVSRPSVYFLGLFDTVASIWSHHGDPHDTGNTDELDVNLGANVAGQVFQLTAMHECRYNYPLSSLKGFYPQLELAGCHSDIGGGYAAYESERSEITDTYYFPSVEEKITKYINSLREDKKWSKLLNDWKPNIHLDKCYGWGEVQKNVRGNLQYVSLLLMVDCAIKYGCKFNSDVINKYECMIVDNLNSYYKSALINMDNVLSGKSQDIPQTLIDNITNEYIHISSTWRLLGDDKKVIPDDIELRSVSGKQENIFDIVFTMRPDERWNRKVYLNNQPL
ncbi:T6SS phospholipase effector Tle1-like catalytic domain-containing protein [Yokenella regensburgei]|uniref:T6SS phospholipase effector Tle1-like catalytic domain-containing protein n=1 Tax=Yokenella regensburgei TaxID=158877 RepID=UPI00137545A3|nr:DUF2235 domain-containing protein [Yokenella regensburgei]KAF1366509.1 hypothetical protein FHR25_005028 [Yokenella regensburgei]